MNYDVIVIGAGPAGYTASLICAKNNLKTLVIEKNKIGGVCLNVGCIPTKTLINISEHLNILKSNELTGISYSNLQINKKLINNKLIDVSSTIIKQIEYLFKKDNVEIIYGEAEILDSNTIIVNNNKYTAKYIILATGSKNKEFLNVNNKNNILDSTDALFLEDIPESITIIGGGAIGVEFGYIYNCLGSKVTILEYFNTLIPNVDEECGKTLERSYKKNNINVITNSKVIEISDDNDKKCVIYSKNEKTEKIYSQYVLVALGRTPNTNIKGINNLNLNLQNGFIITDKYMRSSVSNIYAIGDIVANSPLLAHVAYEEAKIASLSILNDSNLYPIDYFYIPFCIYSEPQIAGFGLNEKTAKEKNIDFKVAKIFYKMSGKALAIGKPEGFIKILVDKNSEFVIGAYICGYNATELIHTLLVLAKTNQKFNELTKMIFAHPTLSELIQEASKIFYNI